MITNFIKSSISWLISQLAISFIVWIIYLILLHDLFKDEITLLHWIGIVLAVSLVFPAGRPATGVDEIHLSKSKLFDLIPNGRQRN
jgi:hypothetical protein